ncbi:uncharacterized protein LOC106733748 [Tupaia chinensis]|uniref:uncharacterized protein LOC106733748 n=1 Tax=Tupaia chinensis TaxID=246437 RepID=UPI00070460C1|nr:uncharacterized protein LOC106733748 [Tupaia chinensis]
MTPALRCACALALVCFASLLLRPESAFGEELQRQQLPKPRAANWLANLGHINKYIEKLFNPKKSKIQKTSNATKLPPLNTKNPLPPNATKPQPVNAVEPRPSTSQGPR